MPESRGPNHPTETQSAVQAHCRQHVRLEPRPGKSGRRRLVAHSLSASDEMVRAHPGRADERDQGVIPAGAPREPLCNTRRPDEHLGTPPPAARLPLPGLEEADAAAIEEARANLEDRYLKHRVADAVWQLRMRAGGIACLLIECQARIDPAMPLQMLDGAAALYLALGDNPLR